VPGSAKLGSGDYPRPVDPLHLALSRALLARGVSRATPVLLAVSGGADSMALMHACACIGQRAQVGHVHHGLRGEAAERDADFVAEAARALGLRPHVLRIAPRFEAPGPRASPEARARKYRYEALEELRSSCGAAWTLTAHSLEDQAETLLLRAIRGSDLEGLAGILPVDSSRHLLRPLLGVPRAQLRAYLRARSKVWREDASNRELAIPRNRIREAVLPELERAHPGALRNLAQLAASAQDWREGRRQRRREKLAELRSPLETLSGSWLDHAGPTGVHPARGFWMHRERFGAHAGPERRALLAEVLCELGLRDRLQRRQLQRLERACLAGASGMRLSLPDAVELFVDGDRVWLGRGRAPLLGVSFPPRRIEPERTLELETHGIRLRLERRWSATPSGAEGAREPCSSQEFRLKLPDLKVDQLLVRPLVADDPGLGTRSRPLIEQLRRARWPQRMRGRALVVASALRPIGVLALDVGACEGESSRWRGWAAEPADSAVSDRARWELRAAPLSGAPSTW